MAVSGLARAQDCAAANVGGYLLDEPKTSCFDPTFMVYKSAGYVMAWLYIVLLIATVLLLRGYFDCRRDCRPSLAKDTSLRFLTEAFKPGFTERTWEAMAMVRKSLLLGLSTGLVFFQDGRTQVTAVLMLLSVSLTCTIAFKPYTVDLTNDLDLLGLFANLAVAFSVSTRVSTAMSTGYGMKPVEQFIFDLVALLLCLPFCLMWLFLLLDTLLFDGYMGLAVKVRARACGSAAVGFGLRALWCEPCRLACCARRAAPVLATSTAAGSEAAEGGGGEEENKGGASSAALEDPAGAAALPAEAAAASGAPRAGEGEAAPRPSAAEAYAAEGASAGAREGFAPTAPYFGGHRGLG